MKKIFCYLLFLFFSIPLFSASTYYVSPSGDSGNTGLTTDSPWPVQYAVDNAGAGSTVMFMDGDYYGVGITLSFSNQILQAINKWKPRFINISNSAAFDTIPNVTYGITLDGLQFTNCEAMAVWLRPGVSNCVIRNIWSHDVGKTWEPSQSASGIALTGGRSNLVENCLLEYCGTNGLLGYNHGIYAGGTNIIIRNNIVRYSGGYGIQVAVSDAQPDQFYIYNNLSYGHYGKDDDGIACLIYYYDLGSWATNYIFGNTFINEKHPWVLRHHGLGTILLTNNILCNTGGTSVAILNTSDGYIKANYNMSRQSLGTWAGANDVITNYIGWVNTNIGLYWLKSDSPARNTALNTVYGPIDFFGNSQSSIGDIGAFKYNSIYSSDTRTLDPSPSIGADYWLILSNVTNIINATITRVTNLRLLN